VGVNIKFKINEKVLNDLRKVGREGWKGIPSKATLGAIRFGTGSDKGGSIAWQFQNETEHSLAGRRKWPASRPFGSYRPSSNMRLTGAYRYAWLGIGPGSKTSITATKLIVGIDKYKFPQVYLHQSPVARTIKPKRQVNGQWAMRLFLGMEYGVWMSNARVGAGFVIPPRRIGVNDEMSRRLARLLEKNLVKPLKG